MNRYRLYTGPTQVNDVACQLREVQTLNVAVVGTENLYLETDYDKHELKRVLEHRLNRVVRTGDLQLLPR